MANSWGRQEVGFLNFILLSVICITGRPDYPPGDSV